MADCAMSVTINKLFTFCVPTLVCCWWLNLYAEFEKMHWMLYLPKQRSRSETYRVGVTCLWRQNESQIGPRDTSCSPVQFVENWRDYPTEEGLQIMEINTTLYFTFCISLLCWFSLGRKTAPRWTLRAAFRSSSRQEGNEIKHQCV